MNIPRFLSIGLFFATVALVFWRGLGWERTTVYMVVSFAGMIGSVFPSESVELIPSGTNDGRVMPEEFVQLVGILALVACVVKLLFWP